MQIVFNGKPTEIQAQTVLALLAELGLAAERVALELNREILPRRLWADTSVNAGDRIEVVQFVGGG